MTESTEPTKPQKAHLSSNPLVNWVFASAGRLIYTGYKNPLTPEQLWDIPAEYHAEKAWEKFEAIWNDEVKKPKPSVVRAVFRAYWWRYARGLLYQIFFGLVSFVNPVLLPYMLQYVGDRSIAVWWGFVYIIIIMAVTVLGSFFYYNALFNAATTGIMIRVTLTQLVYRKVLRIAPSMQVSSGQVVNLVANDTQFFADTLQNFSSGLVAPIQIIVATGLLSRNIGIWSLLAPGVFLLLLPFATWLGKKIGSFRGITQQFADKRLKLTNELLSSIRIVKFYAWEEAFVKNITKSREQELEQVKKLGLYRALLISSMSQVTTIIIAVIFLLYSFFGSTPFNTGTAFSTLSLINLMRFPFTLLPVAINFVQQYVVTFRRINDFLAKPDLEETTISTERIGKADLVIEDGTFAWGEKQILTDINLRVDNGQFVTVSGQVGSGKSSLAMAILGEMKQKKGSRKLTGSVAYVPQEAWIINATVKDNVSTGSLINFFT